MFIFKMKFYILCAMVLTKLCLAENWTFPDSFMFGVSTSSYQIEGAWNEEGKSENIWDRFTHTHPERIADHSTGDKACDSYHKYKEDVQLLNYLGVDFYRFSLSWSRILPTGFSKKINKPGIAYYNNLINELLKNNIKPMVTLYHWDLPQSLQDLGGWANPRMAQYFADYATVAFEYFGDRVKFWMTFNEPKLICQLGYGFSKMAPGLNASGIGEYLCGDTVLKAHAKAYHLYKEKYKNKHNGSPGQIGIVIHSEWFEPATNTTLDLKAADQKMLFDFGWFGHPILHKNGDYPEVMKRRIALRSKMEGFERSRLPILSAEDVKYIQGTFDFLGFNMYTASMVAHTGIEESVDEPSYHKDAGVKIWKDPKWPSSAAARLKVVPWALRKLLSWIKHQYGDIRILIAENGYADKGQLEDSERVDYYKKHLQVLLESIHEDGVHVIGYSAWSLMDNFEWYDGYGVSYGLFHVDFTKEDRPRHPKKSAQFYKNFIQSQSLHKDKHTHKNLRNSGITIEFVIVLLALVFLNILFACLM